MAKLNFYDTDAVKAFVLDKRKRKRIRKRKRETKTSIGATRRRSERHF